MHIVKGSTFHDTLRWASSEVRLLAATLVPAAPLRFSAPGHGLPPTWWLRVEGHNSISATEDLEVQVVDADTLSVPSLNGSKFKAGPVVLRVNMPVDMAGMTARQQIKDKVGGTVLLELTTENDRIVLDNVAKTITRTIDAVTTAGIAWKRGVYDLEMVSGSHVDKIVTVSPVTVGDEVTT